MNPVDARPLILASTSRYRHALLQRLQRPFTAVAPPVDETPAPGEAPRALALRLALAKAEAVARLHPQAVVIGSDQVADLGGEPLGKPGDHVRAVAQLSRMRGQTVLFETAVAVVCLATGFAQSAARSQKEFVLVSQASDGVRSDTPSHFEPPWL